MFGIGATELLLIGIVALVVVGPKNLPPMLRALGRAVREFQRATRELRKDAGFDDVVDEVTRPLREGLSGIEEGMKATVEDDKRAASLEPALDLSSEYPESGPDDYGALPEGTVMYPPPSGGWK